jgi:Tol biopolymer transport system component
VSWAPNGKSISFQRFSDSGSRDEIDVVETSGRNERRVDRGNCAVWSADGQRLAYRPAAGGIAVTRPGAPPRQLVKEKRAGCPAWMADGSRLVYFAAGTPYVVSADTAAVRKPSAAERKRVRLVQDSGQTWSKDGRFLEVEGDFDSNWQVVRISTLHGATATFRWSDDHSPVWSPDRRKLAFVRMQKTEQILIFDTTRRRLRRLAAGTNLAWSPDGNWIAFGRNNRVFVMRFRGGAARPIGTGNHPAWSPDGRFIAATGAGLVVMSRDGKRQRRVDLAAVESAGCPGEAAAPNGGPRWSHDGRRLTFSFWCEDYQVDQAAVVTRDKWRP